MIDVREQIENQPDAAKDRQASRLRAEGFSFREIAAAMESDVAMVHRRVKRDALRRKCEQEQRMQAIRDAELKKLSRLERAILADAFDGDRNALRLVLRIMSMRHRLLKNSPETTDLTAAHDLLDGEPCVASLAAGDRDQELFGARSLPYAPK